jgi:uncharacterized protein
MGNLRTKGPALPIRIDTQPLVASNNPLDTAPDAKSRWIALMRFGIFMVLAVIFTGGAIYVAVSVFHQPMNADAPPSISWVIIVEAITAISMVVLPTAVMVLFGRASADTFGWGRSDRLRNLGIGIASGLGLMSALIGVMVLLGGITFDAGAIGLGPREAAANGLAYLLAFTLVAIAEEGSVRGYALVQLSRAISFWPAALLSSTLFALLHMTHQSESFAGLAQAGIVGLIFAYSFRRTGSLWFAWGCHGAWDFAETFIYGVPDSGMVAQGSLLQASLHGPRWLSGGSAGPEGSWLALPILIVMALVVRFTLRPYSRWGST